MKYFLFAFLLLVAVPVFAQQQIIAPVTVRTAQDTVGAQAWSLKDSVYIGPQGWYLVRLSNETGSAIDVRVFLPSDTTNYCALKQGEVMDWILKGGYLKFGSSTTAMATWRVKILRFFP